MYDLIIIGGGPGGYTAAQKAAREGLNTLLIEKKSAGGTCLNEGCIPAKTLLHSAKLWHKVQTAAKYGIDAEAVKFLHEKVIARKNKIIRKLVAGVKKKITDAGATLLSGEAEKITKTKEAFAVTVGGEIYESKYLILAMGAEVAIPPIPGIDQVTYHTSRETLDNKEIPSSMVIIGGGVIGMEFAAYFSRIGVAVTVVEMLPEILNGIDTEIAGLLREHYAKEGVQFHLNTKVLRLGTEGVTIEKEGTETTLTTERIVLCTGRRPVTAPAESLQIEMAGRGIKVDKHMRTSIEGVYAIGDITGFSQLAHTAVREAEVAVDNILGKKSEMSYSAIPGVVYTDPEVAGVGYSEDQLLKEGIPYTKKCLNMTYAGRFVVENEMGNGLCKILIGSDEKILGVHMLGNPSSELIIAAGIAIECGIPSHRLTEVVFAHPTVSEIIKETLEA